MFNLFSFACVQEKQRAREYERKRDAKRRDRLLYHMRHSRDYEALGLALGASKAEVKKVGQNRAQPACLGTAGLQARRHLRALLLHW